MRNLRVLLIDDESIVICKNLASEDIQIITREDYRDAFQLALHEPFDAILMDGFLGEWAIDNGPALVKRLRKAGVTTRIVMFSSVEEYNLKGLQAGANATWSKEKFSSSGWKESLYEVLARV